MLISARSRFATARYWVRVRVRVRVTVAVRFMGRVRLRLRVVFAGPCAQG